VTERDKHENTLLRIFLTMKLLPQNAYQPPAHLQQQAVTELLGYERQFQCETLLCPLALSPTNTHKNALLMFPKELKTSFSLTLFTFSNNVQHQSQMKKYLLYFHVYALFLLAYT
jgi:hypothetical protein